MPDMNRNSCFCGSRNSSPSVGSPGSVLIDTYQVFDSCRDRDCFEDTRVYLDECGQNLIERTTQVRTKCAEINCATIAVEPVQLSRGFFRITVRFYVKCECEACVCPNKPQYFCGLAICEKSVVLYGGEGEVRIFRSNVAGDSFCQTCDANDMSTNLPIAVVETVDPVVLSTRVVEPKHCKCCCCCCDEIPASVGSALGSTLVDGGQKELAVSLGLFSVIRLERPEQYLINAVEYSVPDKECPPNDSGSPCDAFNRMAFPIEEFSPGRIGVSGSNSCGCGNNCGSGCGCRNSTSPATTNNNTTCPGSTVAGTTNSGGFGSGNRK